MAFRRPLAFHHECMLVIAFVLVSCLAGAATAKQTGQLTVFWGRNAGEGTLREACDTGLYSTVVISFYSVFGHGRYWGDLSGHPLAGVGADIKHCQSRNILVLLSIGGPGNGYSLPAPPTTTTSWPAALTGTTGFYRGRKGVRLTATPRCGLPDRRLGAALRTGLFERIHVRFYGNDTCSLGKGGTYGVVGQWEKWTAAFPRTQVYLGLAPAESGVPEGAQGTVAVYLKYLYYDLLPKVQKANNYGGVMVWDRFADKKTRWSSVVSGWA
uniref:Xylanase inhibitor protein 1 n=1 Tax=Aegilops tauschii TaxID=37682 RepID=M8CY16_AEGTA